MIYDTARRVLTGAFPQELVDDLLEHHQAARVAHLCGDWEKCLLRGGKLAETVAKLLHHLREGSCPVQISVECEIHKAEGASGLPDEMRVIVPRHIRVLYDHRNKRGGGHTSFDPNEMDCHVVLAVSDWVLGELLRLYGGLSPHDASKLVSELVCTSMPLIDDLDCEPLSLAVGASARFEIALLLRKRYPNRVLRAQLQRWLPNHKPGNIRATLYNMKQAKEIHENDDGCRLTPRGIAYIEAEIQHELARVPSR